MKQLLLLLIILGFVTISCKKEVIEEPDDQIINADYSHMNGNFLCEKEYHMNYVSGGTEFSDIVLNFEVDGNILKVLQYEFTITNETQTQFSLADSVTGATTTLIFTNNYQSANLSWYQPSYLGGPQYTVNYTGARTSQIETNPYGSILQHPYKANIEGLYIMTSTQINTFTGAYETDEDTLMVTMTNDHTFDVDGNSLVFGQFHTYNNSTSADYSSDLRIIRNISYTSTTIRLEYREVTGFSTTATDSIITIFNGIRV